MKIWLAVWIVLLGRVLAATWVVAPAGDDQGKGTSDAPLKSLPEALRRAAEQSPGAAEIVMKPGNFDVRETCEIGPKHGNLLIRGEPGAVLSGFYQVPANAWKRPDSATILLLAAEDRD